MVVQLQQLRHCTRAVLGFAPIQRSLGTGRRWLTSSSYRFDQHTELQRMDVASGDSSYEYNAFIEKSWSIGDAPNGGYLMALAIKAATDCSNHKDALTVTAYYTSKTTENASATLKVVFLKFRPACGGAHLWLYSLGLFSQCFQEHQHCSDILIARGKAALLFYCRARYVVENERLDAHISSSTHIATNRPVHRFEQYSSECS